MTGDRAPSLQLPSQPDRERSVEPVAKWKNRYLVDQFQKRKRTENSRDDAFIFFRLDTAGAVNQRAAGLEQWNRGPHDFELFVGHARKILRRQAPANVDAAAHHASVAARSV